MCKPDGKLIRLVDLGRFKMCTGEYESLVETVEYELNSVVEVELVCREGGDTSFPCASIFVVL